MAKTPKLSPINSEIKYDMPITPYIKYKKEGYINNEDHGRLSPWGQYRAANSKSVEDEREI